MFIFAMKLLLGIAALAGLFSVTGCSQYGDEDSTGTAPLPPSAMGTMAQPPAFAPDPDAPHRQLVPGEDPGDF